MSLIDVIRILGCIAWGAVALCRFKSVIRVLAGKPDYYDSLWSVIVAIALMILGFHIHWLVAQSSSVYLALNLISLVLGIITIWVTRRYQGARNA